MSTNWGQGAKGAAGGALAGSAIMPGIGTAIGGGLGFLAGAFGGGESENDQAYRKILNDYFMQVGNQQAPQSGPAAQGGYSNFRQNQSGLITRLEALASGQGPSLASQQFKEATDRNQSSQAGMANSGRGGAMGVLNAQNNMGLLGAQAAQGSAGARIQEQQMALQQLGGNISAGRGADESTNQFNAGQQNQQSLANLDARLKTMGLNDQVRLQILSQMGGLNQSQANQPGIGDQIMAGGAGMYAFGAGQAGQNAAKGSGAINGITSKPGYPQWGAYGGGGQARSAPTMGAGAGGWAQNLPPGIGSGNNSGY